MKCELCHQKDAETAIVRPAGNDGAEEELYVCRDCAKRERVRRQKKSQRTRKPADGASGVSISVTGVTSGGEPPPPIVEAIMNAFSGMVSELEKGGRRENPAPEPELAEFPFERTEGAYRIGRRLHLEGLHLIGELEAVHRALRALKMQLVGVEADGVRETGHAYLLKYEGSAERAKRVVSDLLREERNARVRLFEEMPRVFGDSLCRSLAILKNCRLLSPGELFDLLSPLRLAALEKMLDGVTLKEIESMLAEIDLGSREDRDTPEERDRIDAERADRVNRRFEDVVLNERGEEKFL